MKAVIVDHHDSFTYNIAELIRKAGFQIPAVLCPEETSINELKQFTHLILSPGPGLPSDFPISLQILKEFSGKKPILGICLGFQLVVEFYGGQLVNMNRVVHGQPLKVIIDNDSILFRGIPETIEAGFYHSWCVETLSVENILRQTAWLTDHTVAAVENIHQKIFGVQFHPESYMTEFGIQMIQNFLEMEP